MGFLRLCRMVGSLLILALQAGQPGIAMHIEVSKQHQIGGVEGHMVHMPSVPQTRVSLHSHSNAITLMQKEDSSGDEGTKYSLRDCSP